MQCITPIVRILTEGKQKKKVTVPCGQCLFCLKNRQNSWSVRLYEESKVAKTSHFLTITYNDEHINTANKSDLTLFLKRLRKNLGVEGIKYYLVSEYGLKTHRLHYHAIIFNLPFDTSTILGQKKMITFLDKTWGKGHIEIGDVTPSSIAYVTKYLINSIQYPENQEKPFMICSKGLGKSYMNLRMSKYHKSDLRSFYTTESGIKVSLPRYYREKIFSIREKEKIAEKSIIENDKKTDQEIINISNIYESKLYRSKINNQKSKL